MTALCGSASDSRSESNNVKKQPKNIFVLCSKSYVGLIRFFVFYGYGSATLVRKEQLEENLQEFRLQPLDGGYQDLFTGDGDLYPWPVHPGQVEPDPLATRYLSHQPYSLLPSDSFLYEKERTVFSHSRKICLEYGYP